MTEFGGWPEMKTWKPHVEQIGKSGRVFVYISDGTVCMNNPCIAAGDDFAMLLDTTSHVRTTSEFIASVRTRIGKKPIRYTFITHPHGDHYKGYLAAPESVVITTGKASRRLKTLRERNGRKELEFRYENFSYKGGDDVPVPDLTFDGQVQLLGSMEVQLIDCGHCHTTSDAIAYLPDEKVVVCGDILNNYVLADGNECNVKHWIEVMDRIGEMDAEWFVPGHGPVADRAEFKICRDYISFIWEKAQDAALRGLSAREACLTLKLGKWEDWLEPGRRVSLFDVAYRLCRGVDPSREYPDWDINAAINQVRRAKGLRPSNTSLPTKGDPHFRILDDTFDA